MHPKHKILYFLCSLTLLVSASCARGWKTIAIDDPSNSRQCNPNSTLTPLRSEKILNAYQKAGRKVLFGNQSDLLANEILPKNFALSVLVDQQCLLTNKKLSFLTKKISKQKTKNFSKYSKHAAYTVKLPTPTSRSALEKIASEDHCVLGVTQENFIQLASLPNDPLLNNQSYLQTIRFHEIFDDVFTSSKKLTGEYIVAAIDTGYLLTHPDLVNQWWTNTGEIPDNQIDDDQNGVIDDIHGSNQNGDIPIGDPTSVNLAGHGTHVMGFIGAQVNNAQGIAGIMGLNVKLMGINAWPGMFGAGTGNPPMSAVDRSIRYAVDNGAQVINISMQAAGHNYNIQDAMAYAVENGVTVIVAAGNDSLELTDQAVRVPAYYGRDLNGAMAVAATNSANGNLQPEICIFSNRSTSIIEYAAPGCDLNTFTNYGGHGILSTVPSTTDPSLYGYIQGTSMASPIAAAGAIFTYGLLKEHLKIDPTPAQVEATMRAGASINPQLLDKTVQGKQLDLKGIYNYVQSLIEEPPPTTNPPPADCF